MRGSGMRRPGGPVWRPGLLVYIIYLMRTGGHSKHGQITPILQPSPLGPLADRRPDPAAVPHISVPTCALLSGDTDQTHVRRQPGGRGPLGASMWMPNRTPAFVN